MKRGIALASVMVAAWMTMAGTGWAKGSKTSTEAKIHFEKGVELFHNEDYGGALVEFRAAYEAEPHYRVRYNIGVSLYKLARYVEARKELEAYLVEGGDEIPEEKATEIKAILFEISSFVASIDVVCGVDGAVVKVDGKEEGVTPLEQPVLVDVGEHEVQVQVEGHPPFSTTISIPGGTLEKIVAECPEPEAVAVPDEDEGGDEGQEEEPGPDYVALKKEMKFKKASGWPFLLSGQVIAGTSAVAVPLSTISYLLDDESLGTFLVPNLSWMGVIGSGLLLGAQLKCVKSLESVGGKESRMSWAVRTLGWAVWAVDIMGIIGTYLVQRLYNVYQKEYQNCDADPCENKRAYRNAFRTVTYIMSGVISAGGFVVWLVASIGWFLAAAELEQEAKGRGVLVEKMALNVVPMAAPVEGGAVIGLGGTF